MQTLGINTQKVWYAMYSGYTDITEDGFKTGDKDVIYHDPVSMWANVSPQHGMVYYEPFWGNLDYDRTMVTADMDCPIDEHTVLWVGCEPSASAPYNYIVQGVAESLNSITYALKEVSVPNGYTNRI